LFDSSKGISIEVNGENDRLIVKVPELELSINTNQNKGWSATFNNLAVIHKHSTVLQQYLLESGNLTIASKDGKTPYNFTANIPCRYPVLVKDGTPVSQLNISGDITDKGWYATINREIQVRYSEQLIITSNNLSFNLPAIRAFLKNRPKSILINPEKKKTIKYIFNATDSSLFFSPENEILADRVHIENVNDKTIMRLEYGSGYISVDFTGEIFILKGAKLDHAFMSALASKAQFEKGQMSVAAKGKFDKFSILFKIEDTVLKQFSVLQNILAFIDTIPTLITFSLPEYNSRGLPLKSAIIGMVVEEGMATIKSFEMKSPELNMAGSGWIDFPCNKIDMDFNVITQARTNLKKIPLVGYILTGNKKHPSVTVKVSGDLHNPKVENSLLQQTAALPFSILLRTLSLPFHLVNSMVDSTKNSQDGKSVQNSEKENKQ